MATHHIVPTNVLQAVINYLAQKPWGEVQPLMAALQKDAREYDMPQMVEEPADQGHA